MSSKILWIKERINLQCDDCLFWPFSISGVGYGNFQVNKKTLHAHRTMCEMAHGPAPSAAHEAAHSCGNRGCVNPRHLTWKTRSENQLDRRRHGTAVTSRYGNKGKLAPEERREILTAKGQVNQHDLAAKFRVHVETIRLIQRSGQTNPTSRNRLTVVKIQSPWGELTLKDAARMSGISYSALARRRRKGWSGRQLFEPTQHHKVRLNYRA